ncbi:MAG: phosphoribosylformylglycinamidine cyclo-ligase [Acidobacteria bacterium]|jgi:phosphoribosylformylglycinamidine cyclo-ligase|nr:MAG: phosphoribosylformylglycinamidine cyclo-ligase [Acidobacteriota bacterium]
MAEWTYERAGVSLQRAESFVEYIKQKIELLPKRALLFGSFASGVELSNYKNPVLMLTTDGVGTKLKVAQQLGIHHTVGIDLVAMNVNDLLTTGTQPIAFLDYIATGKIDLEVLKRVMDGIVEGCRLADVPLIGGETAEMPDFYPEGVYDLAGFCAGVCEKEDLITGDSIEPGDVLIGLPSSGFHSNGYSLIRKVLEHAKVGYEEHVRELGKTVGELLLEPTRIYAEEVKTLKGLGIHIKGMAHITGGGIPGNLVRVLKGDCRAVVEKSRLPENPLFLWLQGLGSIPEEEMYRTFNMGVGLILVVEEKVKDVILKELKSSFLCGYIEKGEKDVVIV